MAELEFGTYGIGIIVGFLIGFVFMYLMRHVAVDGDEYFAMFVLGVVLMAMLFLGYIIYKEE